MCRGIATIVTAAKLAYCYRRGLIVRGTKPEEAVIKAAGLGFFRVLFGVIVGGIASAVYLGAPGADALQPAGMSIFRVVVVVGVVSWLTWSVIRASDRAFFRFLVATIVVAAIGTTLFRVLGWPEVISVPAHSSILYWTMFAIGPTWGLIRGAQHFVATLKRELKTT